MHSLIDYKMIVADIDQRCREIIGRYGDQILCERGCRGNCCRIHLSIPADACIDLDRLNTRLAAINERFLSEYSGPHVLKERYRIAEALLLE